MINTIISYDIDQLERKTVLSKAGVLHKSKVISDEQFLEIKREYASKLYTPSLVMRVLLFIFSTIGIITVIGPICLMVQNSGESGIQLLFLILGIAITLFTDRILIHNKHHYKSGVTEAGIFGGLAFVAFGLLGFNHHAQLTYAIVGILLTAFAAIRYLNLVALVAAVGFVAWFLFELFSGLGSIALSLMPFIFMATFGALYWSCTKLQNNLSNVIFFNQFIVLKSLALILVYIAGNYFVVRQLSTELMGLNLSEHGDIPLAFVFYALTALIPAAYFYWGIKQKSILFIRVSLLILTLSVITFKYYFSLGHPEITITISGAILIAVALVASKYLKQIRCGFTREKLLNDKWSSQDLTAFIASQTLGINKPSETIEETVTMGGGEFGGGGAGGRW